MDYPNKPTFLAGGGEMADLIHAQDWSETPLGSVDFWPQSLRTAVSLCLASNFPINIIWGPGHTQIYNDGYRIVCGDAHPASLGQDYSVTWASPWPAIGEPFRRALGGETSYLENQRMFLMRNGYLEETFFTFSTRPGPCPDDHRRGRDAGHRQISDGAQFGCPGAGAASSRRRVPGGLRSPDRC